MSDVLRLRITDNSGVDHIHVYDEHAAKLAKRLEAKISRLQAENAKLRGALASLRGQVEGEIEIYLERDGAKESDKYAVYMQGLLDKADAALSPQDANPAPNPPETPGERATGHGSARKGGSAT